MSRVRNFKYICPSFIREFSEHLRNKMEYNGSAHVIKDPKLNHLFDGPDILNVYNSTITNLSAGAPGPDLLQKCVHIFQRATEHRLENEVEKSFLFQYGIAAGLWDFREELAKFLCKNYGDNVCRENLIQTCGATHGLQLAMDTFLPYNAVIFVEEVTYMIALDAFKHFPDMKIVPVPITDEGVDTAELERIALEEKSKEHWNLSNEKLFWAMFYTIPTFHNPCGISMSKACSQNVINIARKLGMMVICDDVYNLLYYGSESFPPKRLFAYDNPSDEAYEGNVVSNGSFSKILAPGTRVGWLELPPRLAVIMRNSGILKSGGASNAYVSGIVTSILQLGLQDSHLELLVNTFKERMVVLCETLEKHLPNTCTFVKPEGGYFVWIKLPESIDAVKFIEWSQAMYQVTAIPGSRFSPIKSHKNYLRLSIAFHGKDKLKSAAVTLCQSLKEFMDKN